MTTVPTQESWKAMGCDMYGLWQVWMWILIYMSVLSILSIPKKTYEADIAGEKPLEPFKIAAFLRAIITIAGKTPVSNLLIMDSDPPRGSRAHKGEWFWLCRVRQHSRLIPGWQPWLSWIPEALCTYKWCQDQEKFRQECLWRRNACNPWSATSKNWMNSCLVQLWADRYNDFPKPVFASATAILGLHPFNPVWVYRVRIA